MTEILWRIVEVAWYVLIVPIVLALFAWIYLMCCGPGLALLRLMRGVRAGTGLGGALAVAAVHGLFFAPALLIFGHTPLVVTVFVAGIAYFLVEQPLGAWPLALSGTVVFVGSVAYRSVRSRYWPPSTAASTQSRP